ncbi:prepilin-type N-terminal cleavage/methylation domain-containing protein [Luteolibacter flavescens]|uniref:Prepilin-type N-terminal cleavage/methylation domain-containing protein n=1 Tax=Luteolibacter flavescens TaxID=1859460 RepID=A0ABT3FR08_9BACT|nr:prepilin-type N-terminal cleavage/methylation domain-containing protein [Luteolibacter flavescens]MCW1885892.1 prepilin-type N-terminal cleavage/methylation domain-containing protein [Luteolibacter flavescens]
MHQKTARPARGFSLIELLVVILIISVLLTMGAVGLKSMGGKGTTTGIATAEAVFDEARAIAVGKGTRSRVLVDVNNPRDADNYKRRMVVVYEELNPQGEPQKDKWVVSSRAIMLPEGVYFSETYSKKNHKSGDGNLDTENIDTDKQAFNGNYIAYEFNSEGICQTAGASFILGTGTRPLGEQPHVTGSAKRDFSGFVVWRNGRTSLFRGPEEMNIPTTVTTF